MAANHFDKASRYTAKLDPPGLLDWLVPGWRILTFDGWLETRTIPFPGAADRICDTVAKLRGPELLEFWALVIEFQTKPDPELFGRLLEYLGRVWIELRPAEKVRYLVGGAVVNLTGVGTTSTSMTLSGTTVCTHLGVAERNLARENAQDTLARIASGEWRRCLLPWIPLMQGGADPSIIALWKSLAEQETDERRRADYAGLALVFSELTDCRAIWKQSLEGWNVHQSMQVLEWQAEGEKRGEKKGKVEGKAELLLRLLQRQYPGQLTPELIAKINNVKESSLLDQWFDEALAAKTLADFLHQTNGQAPK